MIRWLTILFLAVPAMVPGSTLIDGLMFDSLDELGGSAPAVPWVPDRPLERVIRSLPDPVVFDAPMDDLRAVRQTEQMRRLQRAARVFADDGLWAEALQAYRELMQLDPSNLSYLERAALAATLAGRLGAADAYFTDVVAAMPQHADYLTAWGGVLLRLGRWADAQQVLARSAAIRPNHTMLLLYSTITEVLQGETPSDAPWMYASFNELAEAAQALSDKREGWSETLSEQQMSRLVAAVLGPLPLSALSTYIRLINQARIAIHQEQWEGARLALAELAGRQDARPMVSMEYARSLQRIGSVEAALTLAERVAMAHPQQPLVQYAFGYLLVYGGAYAEAAAAFEHSLAAMPDRADYLFALACAWSNAGRIDEAWPLLQRLAAEHPASLTYWMQGDAEYLSAIREDPRYPELSAP
jgi:tetratricopeptide (TPR) repeat protein